MSAEDLQLEDIVLLQLFKDQIMNSSLDQAKCGFISAHAIFISHIFISVTTERFLATKLIFPSLRRHCQTQNQACQPIKAGQWGQTTTPWQDWLWWLDTLH